MNEQPTDQDQEKTEKVSETPPETTENETQPGEAPEAPNVPEGGEPEGESESPAGEDGEESGLPKDNGASGEKPDSPDNPDSPMESAKMGVLILLNKNGQLVWTPDVPMELEKRADLNDVEMMLTQCLEAVKGQRIAGIVRKEISAAAPHLADHIVNCMHARAMEESKKTKILRPS